MPLIPCPECGREISTQAAACPQCGAPAATVSPTEKRRRSPTAMGCLFAALSLVVVIILLLIVAPKDGQREKAIELCAQAGVRGGYRECLDFIDTMNRLNKR